ncbi:MAG: hypothetical protein ACD_54C00214G0003 [uncultured bacterium]|nr:MAG: hypothetical protein ACD_54C00214G0003 [uncultured bacterium]
MAARVPDHRLPLPVGLVTFQMRGDLQDAAGLKADALQPAQPRIVGRGHAVDHRQIMPVHRMGFELRRQPVMGAVGLRHHQKASGVLVDAMHNAGAAFATDTRQRIAAMEQQRIDQRA